MTQAASIQSRLWVLQDRLLEAALCFEVGSHRQGPATAGAELAEVARSTAERLAELRHAYNHLHGL